MFENLLHAYTPLFTWIGLGLLLSRFVTEKQLKFLGQSLYWVGVPLQLFVLARQTNISSGAQITIIAILVLGLSLLLAWGLWYGWQWLERYFLKPVANSISGPSSDSVLDKVTEQSLPQLPNSVVTSSTSQTSSRATLGSFLLAAILGNTGFVGLTLTEILSPPEYNDWAILFSVTNNVVGTYGIAVLIASYFGDRPTPNNWWIQVRDVLTVPSLWAFFIGLNTQFIKVPTVVETALDQMVWVVIALALCLAGLRLGTIKTWQGIKLATIASVLKVILVPFCVGLVATYYGTSHAASLVLVLMSGTPTGLSVLILAEVYELDRDLLSTTIVLTFVGLFCALPLWLWWFG